MTDQNSAPAAPQTPDVVLSMSDVNYITHLLKTQPYEVVAPVMMLLKARVAQAQAKAER